MVMMTITFDEILPIWRDYLWPNRKSEITTNSAMCFLNGYDLSNMETIPTFFAYKIDGATAGVNSGHMCKNLEYRSRGLFVFEKFRGRGIGKKLLVATIDQARLEGATMCWSYPKDTSWRTYASAGFMLASDFLPSETGKNAFCELRF
jgi:GNAT superfamily N-acetyltransferase